MCLCVSVFVAALLGHAILKIENCRSLSRTPAMEVPNRLFIRYDLSTVAYIYYNSIRWPFAVGSLGAPLMHVDVHLRIVRI